MDVEMKVKEQELVHIPYGSISVTLFNLFMKSVLLYSTMD